MELGKILKKSLHFSFDPKRWMQHYLLNLFFITLILVASLALRYHSSLSAIFLYIVILLISFISYLLLNILVRGALVYQSYKEKRTIKESYREVYKKYWSLFGAAIIVGVISFVVGLVPYIGFIFSIFVLLLFFFIFQGVIIKNLKFDETLEQSIDLFKKNWVLILVVYVVLILVSWAILLLFSIPLISLVWMFFSGHGPGDIMNLLLEFVISNMVQIIISVLVALVGISISYVLSIKVKTEVYLALMKKKK